MEPKLSDSFLLQIERDLDALARKLPRARSDPRAIEAAAVLRFLIREELNERD